MNLSLLKQEAREEFNRTAPSHYHLFLDTLIDKVVEAQHLHVVRGLTHTLESGKELNADAVLEAFRNFRV